MGFSSLTLERDWAGAKGALGALLVQVKSTLAERARPVMTMSMAAKSQSKSSIMRSSKKNPRGAGPEGFF